MCIYKSSKSINNTKEMQRNPHFLSLFPYTMAELQHPPPAIIASFHPLPQPSPPIRLTTPPVVGSPNFETHIPNLGTPLTLVSNQINWTMTRLGGGFGSCRDSYTKKATWTRWQQAWTVLRTRWYEWQERSANVRENEWKLECIKEDYLYRYTIDLERWIKLVCCAP